MDELDLIAGYVGRHGCEVRDILYYAAKYDIVSTATIVNVGVSSGYAIGQSYFFGNVEIHTRIGGTIVLTNLNNIQDEFINRFKGADLEDESIIKTIGINNGVSLMGDGSYEGNTRLYGIGFNKIGVDFFGAGAAVFQQNISINGYLFRMN